MLLPLNHATMGGERYEDENEGRVGEEAGTGGSGETSEEMAMSRGNGGGIRDRPVKVIPCPRCQSMNTKFCYYNNYSVTQPRHFCRNCQRYWTVGGTLRNVPVGGGSRKKTRTRSRSDPYHIPSYDSNAGTPQSSPGMDSLLNASTCMQQLSMLPPSLGFPPSMVGGFSSAGSQLPFLQSALDGLYPCKPLAGLQEVPDLQSIYDTQIAPMAPPPMVMNGMGFFTPQSFPSQNEPLVSMMAKAGLWSSPMQTPVEVQGGAPGGAQGFWEEQQKKGMGGYGGQRNVSQSVMGENLKPGFWENVPLMHSRPVMNDRLVPHASWEESNPSTTHNTPNLSPNGSSTTDSMANPSYGYCEDVSQPWVGLHATDILNF